MNPLLSARDLGHRFGAHTVFTGINLRVNHGDRVAVLGASGCGKTTLLRILCESSLDSPRPVKVRSSARPIFRSAWSSRTWRFGRISAPLIT
jgi:ABC-type Fe3+/spermidine/putrescine transport system ATPase subunit